MSLVEVSNMAAESSEDLAKFLLVSAVRYMQRTHIAILGTTIIPMTIAYCRFIEVRL